MKHSFSNQLSTPKAKAFAKSPQSKPTQSPQVLTHTSTINLIRALNSKKITPGDYYKTAHQPQQKKPQIIPKPKIQSREYSLPTSVQKPLKRMKSVCPSTSKPLQTIQSASTSDQKSPISLSDFILGKVIGKGSYGTVKSAVFSRTGQSVAIKIYDKMKLLSSSRTKSVNREVQILRRMNHPNIVKFVARIDTPKFLYIAMEYVSGTSLSSYFKRRFNRRLDERQAKDIIQQTASALQYCHEHNITHRDIKLQNVLITQESHVKVIDFGFSTCFPIEKKVKMFCGTPKYMAPEIVALKEFAGPPVDVWALGVMLYVLLTGNFPFRGATERELYKRIQTGQFEIPPYLSFEANQLLREMMRTNPDARASMLLVLNSSWLKNLQDIGIRELLAC